MPHPVKILRTEFITPDVKRFVVDRPKGYKFVPGQATDVAIDRPGYEDQLRPFTFTCLTTARRLEFIIKIYGDHDGVTKQLGLMHAGDGLLLHEPFGAITYQGPGFFIAGGAGVTPFIAILRDLHKKDKLKGNTLLVSNHTANDVILDDELAKMLGRHFLKVFTRQHVIGFRERRIDRDTLVVLVQNFDQKFYVCGPDPFVKDISGMLLDLGARAESLVVEE
ncbi:MAG: flavodoxin reductase [Flavobacteriales bacterium]|nr:flavodoxin reductase [Flavobacteriales bacterium]